MALVEATTNSQPYTRPMTRFVPSILQKSSRSSVQSDDTAVSAYSQQQRSKRDSTATVTSTTSPLVQHPTNGVNVGLLATAGPGSYPQPTFVKQDQQQVLSNNHALSPTQRYSTQPQRHNTVPVGNHGPQPLVQQTHVQPNVPQTKSQQQDAYLSHSEGLRKVYAQVQSILADHQQHAHFRKIELNAAGVLKVEMNPERLQCPCCRQWFFNAPGRQQHHFDLPGNCDSCRLCFRADDVVQHAATFQHSRCFIPGCKSNFRIESIYTNDEIYNHVLTEHSPVKRK